MVTQMIDLADLDLGITPACLLAARSSILDHQSTGYVNTSGCLRNLTDRDIVDLFSPWDFKKKGI